MREKPTIILDGSIGNLVHFHNAASSTQISLNPWIIYVHIIRALLPHGIFIIMY